MDQDDNPYKAIFAEAKGLLSQLRIGDEFSWRGLLGEDSWLKITIEKRAQTVGDQLSRHFSRGPHPVIEFVRVNRSPHFTVFRKIGEVNEGG